MKRVVSSTLAAEAQSLPNGLGHAEWVAAHLAEMRCPYFDVERRAQDIQHFKLHCVVDAMVVDDHLRFLSSLASVEDKWCAFDFVVARQCVARLTATIRWAPTDIQFADALTEDCATAMDLLRSCLKKSEYQLSPEQTMLQRAADETEGRQYENAVRQVSRQHS